MIPGRVKIDPSKLRERLDPTRKYREIGEEGVAIGKESLVVLKEIRDILKALLTEEKP